MISQGASILDRFRMQVAKSPERIAIEDSRGGRLTYQEVNVRSNHIARMLKAEGFKGGIVGILLPSCVDAIAAILGTLRAGGAFLFLDPENPASRNRRFLTISGATMLLTSSRLFHPERFDDSGREEPKVIHIDGMKATDELIDDVVLEPEDAAYIVFTSGSTGQPKGAVNTHQAVLDLVSGLQSRIDDLAGYLQVGLVASFSFDASIQQIFLSLIGGHTLHISSPNDKIDGSNLIKFYDRHGIDLSDGTPAHLKMMTQALEMGDAPPPVRRFLIGGEALEPGTISRFLQRFGDTPPTLTNLYGVAECGVDATVYRVDLAEVSRLGFVPIGKPLPHLEALLLNDEQEPIHEAGATGEICLSGTAIGRGYVGQPELTAERFNPHPVVSGERIYRTGDLGEWMADGRLRYLGRADRQIQLRGYRIELDEIERMILTFERKKGSGEEDRRSPKSPEACWRCCLTGDYPGINFLDGVCSLCRWYDEHRKYFDAYFKTPESLTDIVAAQRKRAKEYDALLLYSGGKDSTYALYKLLNLGLRVLTFTFDNGYISDSAFRNVERITSKLGVHHITGKASKMKEIFRISLEQDSTVCSGCFRGLTSLSTSLASQHGINMVFTGLSRGQIVETKLFPLIREGIFDEHEVDQRLSLHRKLYQLREDRAAELLGIATTERALNEILFLDYFRFDDATVPEVMSVIKGHSSLWQAPEDTGLCSTNCRVNDVGIYVHHLERGFHNYSGAISWDCRLGLVSREDGLRELRSVPNSGSVQPILEEIGYRVRDSSRRPILDAAVVRKQIGAGEPLIAAYYVGNGVSAGELRRFLRSELPAYMVPSRLEAVDRLPLLSSQKKDYKSLAQRPLTATTDRGSVEPQNETERRLSRIWREVLEHYDFGIDDDFLEVGGDSLRSTVMVALITQEFGIELSLIDAFRRPTVRHIASLITSKL